ncbi:hypothetical protein BDQ12DRAFT_726928 [Crucibulum laeve]|uniref:F-box domain-containing protein n=1 Tax=Crucibulum laeve TaxID=68775 RepID=A0A5C3LMI5_9AGAR|nr:hypothetical protein BDQ12DRAFT_726928 [Crucibulum laeve]
MNDSISLNQPLTELLQDTYRYLNAPTTLVHLLTTNAPPSPAQASLVEQVLISLDRAIKALDAEILHLEMKRAELTSQRIVHQRIMSPLRMVPPEVMVEIFYRALPFPEFAKNKKARHLIHKRTLSTLLNLSLVSRHWCEIVHGTPQLWDSVSLDLNDSPNCLIAVQKALTWAGRSETPPLTVTLTGLGASTTPYIKEFIDGSNLSRWADVHLRISRIKDSPFHSRRKWDSLHSLSISVDGDRSVALNSSLFLDDAPNLRKLRVVESWPISKSIEAPWSQLTTLHLYNKSTPSAALSILEKCSNIEELELDLTHGPDSSLPSPLTAILLPCLKRLSLAPNASFLISHIRAHRVSEITLRGSHRTDIVIMIESFIERSMCYIGKLAFMETSFDDEEMFSIIRLFHGLKELLIHSSKLTGVLFQRLPSSAVDEIESLDLEVSPEFNRLFLAQYLDLRQWQSQLKYSGYTRVKRLSLKYISNPSFDLLIPARLLDSLHKRGMEIHVDPY